MIRNQRFVWPAGEQSEPRERSVRAKRSEPVATLRRNHKYNTSKKLYLTQATNCTEHIPIDYKIFRVIQHDLFLDKVFHIQRTPVHNL